MSFAKKTVILYQTIYIFDFTRESIDFKNQYQIIFFYFLTIDGEMLHYFVLYGEYMQDLKKDDRAHSMLSKI